MTALTIQRVGWACYIVTSENGTKVVIDPYLHGSGDGHSGLPESPFLVDDLADADVVAVTHAGFDHRAQAIDVSWRDRRSCCAARPCAESRSTRGSRPNAAQASCPV
jgi:L-ascorbate metabolism protein UlaG (beta-lactamase superfamily)